MLSSMPSPSGSERLRPASDKWSKDVKAMASRKPLDYLKTALYINSIKVVSLTMVGLLAERVPNIARGRKRVGLAALTEADLPDHLTVCLDSLGMQQVKLKPDDKTLALSIAKAVRLKIRNLGLDLVDSCVPVYSAGNRKLEEHDMELEQVDDGDGAPAPEPVQGIWSCELKVKRLYDIAEREKRRLELQKKCVGEGEGHGNCAWWPGVEQDYAGRLLVMAVLTEKAGFDFVVNIDARKSGQSDWRPVSGWIGSRRTNLWLSRQPAISSGPSPAPARSPSPLIIYGGRAKAGAKAKAAPANPRPYSFSFVGLGLSWRDKDGVSVVEVRAFLPKVGKDEEHASYYCKRARTEHGWSNSVLFQMERTYETSVQGQKRRKLGGPKPWFASKEVLLQMCQDHKFVRV